MYLRCTLSQIIRDEPISESPYLSATTSLQAERTNNLSDTINGQSLGISSTQAGANNSGKGEKSKIIGAINNFRGTTEKILATLPKTLKIFQMIINIGHSLGEFRRLLLSVFVKVLDDGDIAVETRRLTLCYLMHLSNDTELHQFVPRIAHPLMRILNSKRESSIQTAAVTAFSCLVCRLGANYAPYVVPVRRQMKTTPLRDGLFRAPQIDEYETLVARLLRQKSLPSEPASAADIAIRYVTILRLYSAFLIDCFYDG